MPERVRHNHLTRDVKPPGQCPACDEYHRSQGRVPTQVEIDYHAPHRASADAEELLTMLAPSHEVQVRSSDAMAARLMVKLMQRRGETPPQWAIGLAALADFDPDEPVAVEYGRRSGKATIQRLIGEAYDSGYAAGVQQADQQEVIKRVADRAFKDGVREAIEHAEQDWDDEPYWAGMRERFGV